MPATYRCSACEAMWSEDITPTDCPRCGSRDIARREPVGAAMNNPYAAPGASIAADSPVSSTAFSVLFFLGIAGLVLGLAILIVTAPQDVDELNNPNPNAAARPDQPLAAVGMVLYLGSWICLVAAWIVSLVKLYRGWKLIQPLRRLDREETDMPTPGAAVGLLFVPFFNLYWYFVALRGLAVRANKYRVRVGIGGRPMSEGLALTYAILLVIPFFTFLAIPVVYYLFTIDVDRMRGEILAWQADRAKPMPIEDL
jgi:DNA-directed RNA polymerase subunit RPC12/RpoP